MKTRPKTPKAQLLSYEQLQAYGDEVRRQYVQRSIREGKELRAANRKTKLQQLAASGLPVVDHWVAV